MGLLLSLMRKHASDAPPGSPAPSIAAPPPAAVGAVTPPTAAWHPQWVPDAGWKTEENPAGWIEPKSPARKRELFLWDQWKKAGETPEATAPMLGSMRSLIGYGIKGWAKRTPLATPVLEHQATNLVLEALSSYNPNKAQITTHVTNSFKGMNRFVKERQNTTRIVEGRIKFIGDMDRAIARLTERLEREPTVSEVADEAKIPVDVVSKLLLERHADRLSSGATEDPFIDEVSPNRLTLQLIRYSLTPDEEKVFDYLSGANGAKILRPGEIAKKEGWSPSKVSTIKKSLAKKIKAVR